MNSPAKNMNKEARNLIKRWVSNNLDTLSIATIISTKEYSKSRLVDVLPLPIEKHADGNARVPSAVYRCPVILQGTGEGFISFPLKSGDEVIIGYCKHSLAEYIFSSGAGQYLPSDLRIFGANNVVVLGTFSKFLGAKEVDSENFKLNFQDSNITITPDNKVSLANPEATVELDNDGTINITNNQAVINVNASGLINISGASVNINGASVSSSGNLVTARGASLDELYRVYNSHTHRENNDTTTSRPNQRLP